MKSRMLQPLLEHRGLPTAYLVSKDFDRPAHQSTALRNLQEMGE